MAFLRLLPRLSVRDLAAEVAFYERLGFVARTTAGGSVTLEADGVAFGLHEDRHAPGGAGPGGTTWQMEVDDVHAVAERARRAHLITDELPRQQADGEWTWRLRTPGGYLLLLQSHADPRFGCDLRSAALALPGVVELHEDGRRTYRVGRTLVAAQPDPLTAEVRLRPEDVPAAGAVAGVVPAPGGARVDLAAVDPDVLAELLRTSHDRWSPPVPDVGLLRQE
ncbi:VOC family protein [Kineococcus gynurae]|uniref:VOC family protein n=1 Tax=Kineococcus gynurae TaxID=452979 RepID=A0ABV5LT39_9ACTN